MVLYFRLPEVLSLQMITGLVSSNEVVSFKTHPGGRTICCFCSQGTKRDENAALSPTNPPPWRSFLSICQAPIPLDAPLLLHATGQLRMPFRNVARLASGVVANNSGGGGDVVSH